VERDEYSSPARWTVPFRTEARRFARPIPSECASFSRSKAVNIAEHLRSKGVPFQGCRHPSARNALGLAEIMHVDPRTVAKTVLLRVNGGFKYLVAVLPATHVVDFERLSKSLGGTHVELATQAEIAERCPDCERGVLPPFGTMYGLETVVDPAVAENQVVVFEGNSFEDAIQMNYRDYAYAEHPLVVEFAIPAPSAPKPR
jgi:Ala-tRNA(Pro) deacylase